VCGTPNRSYEALEPSARDAYHFQAAPPPPPKKKFP